MNCCYSCLPLRNTRTCHRCGYCYRQVPLCLVPTKIEELFRLAFAFSVQIPCFPKPYTSWYALSTSIQIGSQYFKRNVSLKSSYRLSQKKTAGRAERDGATKLRRCTVFKCAADTWQRCERSDRCFPPEIFNDLEN
jgi:hypothetical protein